MKKLTYMASLACALVLAGACQNKEDDFVIQGEPFFKVDVYLTDDAPSTTLDESVQYTLNQEADAYSAAANVANHVRKAVRFKVSSNLRWKVEPAGGDAYDWIHPFPGTGEKDGIFFFKSERNVNPASGRTAYFNVLVDKGKGYEPLEGMITVEQAKSGPFLELSDAKFNVQANAQTKKLRVNANVDWTYTLTPMEDYATENLDWIEDKTVHTPSKQVDTLVLKIAANEAGVRGANITIAYQMNGRDTTEVIPLMQLPATEVELEGFPVKWAVRVSPNTYAATWPSAGTIAPVSGDGVIRFNNNIGKAADVNGKCLLDVSDNCPRVTGVWPGDYCEFVASSAVSAGTIIKLSFATRVSATGHKYWRLEYRDGEEWKIAGKPQTDPSVTGPDGNPVVYTHTMIDASTNLKVESVVVYQNNTDQVEFRFICAANWQLNGSGALAAPNGGTWRLAVDSKEEKDEYQPMISCVAAGAEKLTQAKLSVDADYLVFEGKNPAEKTLKISSDQDVSITPDQDWIHVDKTAVEAADEIVVKVTVDESTLSENREGVVVVKSGITRHEVGIIQGAAGQQLDPFISLSDGNAKAVEAGEGSVKVRVQTNTEVSTAIEGEWITEVTPLRTKGLVEWNEYVVSYAANESEEPREGRVRFYNEAQGIESVLTLTQAGKEAVFENNLIQWGFSADLMAAYKDSFEKDNAFKANVAGTGVLSWHNLDENVALDVDKKKSQQIGATGQPYVTGVWPGDYWLFTIPLKDVAKNSVITFTALHKVSATGHRFWKMEYSIDGTNWYPVRELMTETVTGTNAQYTHELTTTSDTQIEEKVKVPMDIPEATLQIRFTCVANWQQKGSALAKPNGGTHRWSGTATDGPTITITEPGAEPAVFPVVWSFPAAGNNWVQGTDYDLIHPTGSYVYSDTHEGKLTVFRGGDTSPSKPTYTMDGVFGADTWRLLNYGMYKDDYWLFEVNNVDNPAGTYGIHFKTTASGSGPKFFMLEYSVDGTNWVAVNSKTTTETMKDANATTRDVTYTFAISYKNNTSNEVCEVNETLKAPALKVPKLYVRARICDTMVVDRKKELNGANHGGTNRIGGQAQITFTAD